MPMHLLFLGIAKLNYKLCNIFLKEANKPIETFKNDMEPLLKSLQRLGLNWLLAYPFSGKKGKKTTGTWVSENNLAWICISKVAYMSGLMARQTASKRAQMILLG